MKQAHISEKGMTLIEVLASLAILSFLAIGTLQFIQFLSKEEPNTNSMEQATLIGQEHLQYIIKNPTAVADDYPKQVEKFTIDYFMSDHDSINEERDLPKDSIIVHGFLDSSAIQDKKLVTVVVSWEN